MKLIIAFLFLLCSLSYYSQTDDLSIDGPRIKFISKIYDYGTIQKGADGRGTFKFTNTGNAPLIISIVKSSCGCLMPMYQRKPVLPGDTAIIGCRYDTKRLGPINKSMTVISNAVNAPRFVVRIKGVVHDKFIELVQSQFEYDLGTIGFNEFKNVELDLKTKNSTSRLIFRYGVNTLIEESPYSDMIKYTKKDLSKQHRQVSINFSNIYGNVGKKTFVFEIKYNNKIPIKISITANFTGFPGNRTFSFTEKFTYGIKNKTCYFENDKIKKIEIEEKRTYAKPSIFRIMEIKYFENGVVTTVVKKSYYANKVQTRYYKLENGELVFLYEE